MPKGNEVISLFALEQKANELILMLHVGWREAGEKPHATHVEGEEQNNTPPLPNCSCNSSPNSNQTPSGATSSSRLLIYVKNCFCGNVFALNRKTLAKNNARITVAGSWDAQCPECSPGLLDSAGFDCKIY